MKNSILEFYYLELKSLYAKAPSGDEKIIIKELATKLLNCRSQLEIANLLNNSSYKEKNNKNSHYSKLFHCLEEWKSKLDKTMELDIRVRSRLETLDQSDTLIRFIKRVLANKFSLVHIRFYGLLSYLNSPLLDKTLSDLAELPKADWPQILNQGDYLAVASADEIHRACLTLLNNNSQACSTGNAHWNLANSILQSTLQIYEDIQDIVEQDRIVNFDVLSDFADDIFEPYYGYSCICM